ncbi:MAG: HlyD family efflux transporter periplasmic adaptor subunit [Gemmatimonadales bacterium]
MDIARAPKNKRPRYLIGGAATMVLVLVVAWVRNLDPVEPEVTRGTLIIDSVRRGDVVREVRGPGTLVPERIRIISAVTSARVDRIVAQPGQSVSSETVLLEMSNPDVQIEALQAQQALSEAESRIADLRVQLEGGRLTQEGLVATIRTQNVSAVQERNAADTLITARLISRFEYNNRHATADEFSARLRLEQQRLALMTESAGAQLAAQRRQIQRLQAIATFQQNRVQTLVVRAGEEGVLQDLTLQPGQWVNAGTTLGRVVQPGKLKAVLRIGETLARDIAIGQAAIVDTRNGIVKGHVSRMDPAAQGGTVTIDVSIDGPLPAGARPDVNVDGTVQLERLKNVIYTGRPTLAQENAVVGLFRLDPDGKTASRVQVRIGRVSANTIEIVQGLTAGDRIILSEVQLPDGAEKIRIK